jgi:hypothetical protein
MRFRAVPLKWLVWEQLNLEQRVDQNNGPAPAIK